MESPALRITSWAVRVSDDCVMDDVSDLSLLQAAADVWQRETSLRGRRGGWPLQEVGDLRLLRLQYAGDVAQEISAVLNAFERGSGK